MTTMGTPIETGTPVFGSDNGKIGDVAEVQRGYFRIEKGFIFTKDVYLPTTSIVGPSEDGSGVMLDLRKDDIDGGDYSAPPVLPDQEEAGPVGYAGQHQPEGTVATGTAADAGHGSTRIIDDDART